MFVCSSSGWSKERRGMRLPNASFMVSGLLLNPVWKPFPWHMWVTTSWAAEHTFKYLKGNLGGLSCYQACWWNNEYIHHELFAFIVMIFSRLYRNNLKRVPFSFPNFHPYHQVLSLFPAKKNICQIKYLCFSKWLAHIINLIFFPLVTLDLLLSNHNFFLI